MAKRNGKFDAEKQDRLCAMVSIGATVRSAAELCGITESAVRARQQRDPAFRDRLEKAKQSREIAPLRHIREACSKNWRAAAWLLERARPHEYAKRKGDDWKSHEVAATLHSYGELVVQAMKREIRDRTVQQRVAEQLMDACDRIEQVWKSGPDVVPGRLPKVRRRRRPSNRAPGEYEEIDAEFADIDEAGDVD